MKSKPAALILVIALLAASSPTMPAWASQPTSLIEPGEVLAKIEFNGRTGAVDWSPDGSLIAVAFTSSAKLDLVRPDGTIMAEYSLPYSGERVEWKPSGDLIAVGAGTRLILISPNGIIALDKNMGSHIMCLSWSRDGQLIALGLENGTIAYYNFRAGMWRRFAYSSAAVTAVAWSSDNKFLLWGDSDGIIRVLDIDSLRLTTSYKVSRSPITSLSYNPVYNIVAFSTVNTTYMASFNRGNITIYTQIPRGTLGNIEWSPDGERLIIPYDQAVAIVGRDGSIAREVHTETIYPYRWASWNPTNYSQLALSGYNTVYSKGGLVIVYSGALVSITTSPPITKVCYSQTCGSSISFNPVTETYNVTLTLEAGVPGGGVQIVNVTVAVRALPFQEYSYKAFSLLANTSLTRRVMDGRALVVILWGAGASASISNSTGEYNVSSNVIVVEPGAYNITIYHKKPSSYIGPSSLFVKKVVFTAHGGDVLVYNFTGFNPENHLALIQLLTVPGSTLTVSYNGSKGTTSVTNSSATYLVPAGHIHITLELPSKNVLVSDMSMLEKSIDTILYPGDVLHLTFTYNDILGRISIKGPEGAILSITPPWSTPYHQVKYNFTLTGQELELWAYPGVYSVEGSVEVPANFIGPKTASVEFNITVERGRTAWIDLYSQGNLSTVLALLERSANLIIESEPGYTVSIHYDNKTLEYNLTNGTIKLLVPPGEYTLNLIDPNRHVIVNTKQLTVAGPGNITLSLQAAVPSTTPSSAPVVVTQTGSSGMIKKALGVLIILIVVVVAAVLVARMRARALEF